MRPAECALLFGKRHGVVHCCQERIAPLLAVLPRHPRRIEACAKETGYVFQFGRGHIGRAETRYQLRAFNGLCKMAKPARSCTSRWPSK